jgi:hypothetical protein
MITTAMIGSGLTATPTAIGKDCPIAFPMTQAFLCAPCHVSCLYGCHIGIRRRIPMWVAA